MAGKVIQYLTGVSNRKVREIATDKNIGLLITPDTNGYRNQIDLYPAWAADNACFNHPEKFKVENFLSWLGDFTPAQRERCLFAVAPDVVGDAVKTIERSLPVLPKIRALGYPAAFVAQDGLENLDIPWDAFDVLFIGGSTEWKLSGAARKVAREAKIRGKAVHMGRVNSYKRMKIASDFGCDTADGTFLAFGPGKNLPRLLDWLDRLAAEQFSLSY